MSFWSKTRSAFGDTIKVMAIMQVGSEHLKQANVSADMLGEALNIARRGESGSRFGFQRFD